MKEYKKTLNSSQSRKPSVPTIFQISNPPYPPNPFLTLIHNENHGRLLYLHVVRSRNPRRHRPRPARRPRPSQSHLRLILRGRRIVPTTLLLRAQSLALIVVGSGEKDVRAVLSLRLHRFEPLRMSRRAQDHVWSEKKYVRAVLSLRVHRFGPLRVSRRAQSDRKIVPPRSNSPHKTAISTATSSRPVSSWVRC